MKNLVKLKIPNHDKYITTPEFNRLTAENFTVRLKQTNLVTETDFDENLTDFNRKITSNKTKHLEVEKKLNSLITKDYNIFYAEIILQVMMDLKKWCFRIKKQTKVLILFLVGN